MKQIETEAMIDSLSHLQGYYQSRYEYYLVMATEAKEHRERVSLLLQDLLAHGIHEENYLMEKPHNNQSIDAKSLNNGSRVSPILSSMSSNETGASRGNLDALPGSISPTELDEDNFGTLGAERTTHHGLPFNGSPVSSEIKKFLDSLSQVMSVIESISNSDSGKTLHQSYLNKILNLELKTELSIDLVELYLEEAITRGYLKLDEFDSSCYIAQGHKSPSNSIQDLPSKQNKNLANRKPYNLPPSSKLKPTLLETIRLYIAECSPIRFSIEDVINYLYSPQQQLGWSQTKKNKVRSSISNVLSRKTYLGKQWKRLRPGIYQPL